MIKILDILEFLQKENIPYTFEGDEQQTVDGFSSLARYKEGTLTWVKIAKKIPKDFPLSKITLAIVSEGITGEFKNAIYTPQSKRAFFSTIAHFYGQEEERPDIGQFTYISPKVKLGKNVKIGHHCILDGDITIGDNTVIWHRVTMINRVKIGQNCTILSGAVIGHNGFSFTEDEEHRKTMIKHFGGVSIGDNVLIGDNVCISRGTIDDTVLEDGVKVDALSHVGHNCWLEKNVALAAPCEVNGSSHLEPNVYMAGGMVRSQCTIGENTLIGLGAVVVKDVEANQTVIGNPAKPLVKKKD